MTDRYTHVGLFDERAAIEAMIPDYSVPSEGLQIAATGTDDSVVDAVSNKPNDKPSEGIKGSETQPIEVKAVRTKQSDDDKRFLIRRSQDRVLAGVFVSCYYNNTYNTSIFLLDEKIGW
jgi:hypothetical protein